MGNESYFYRIKELMVPHPAPESVVKDIDNFIDTIEDDARKLEDCLAKSDLAAFRSQLQKVQDKVRSVYAKRLEVDGYALSHAAGTSAGLDNCRKLLKPYVTNLYSLSIEMQKAQNQQSKPSAQHSVAEKYGATAQNLSAIGKLIDTGEHSKAQKMVTDMQKMNIGNKDEMAIALDNALSLLYAALNECDYNKASKIAHSKHDEYMSQVTQKGNMNKKILAVDDRPEILNIVNSVLSKYFKVLAATSGSDALKIMQQHQIDLFILDVEMPVMDGFELTKKIRAEGKYSSTPIMFFTSNSSRERIKTSMELGICDFIVKPSYPETLLVQAAKYLV
ncbi:MAG: response regulator [Defluviitaleaceae bacterium]|nr:response regulator [Defluviitaleaceae bacterium]